MRRGLRGGSQGAGGIPVPGDFVDLDTYPLLLWLRADVDWTAASWTNHGTDATYSPAALAKTGAGADPTSTDDVIDGLPGITTSSTAYYSSGAGTFVEIGDAPTTIVVGAPSAFDDTRYLFRGSTSVIHGIFAQASAGLMTFSNALVGPVSSQVNDTGNTTDIAIYENRCDRTDRRTFGYVNGTFQGQGSQSASEGLRLACDNLLVGENLDSYIVEVISFREAPPQAQITALYNGYLFSRFPSLAP